MAIASSMSQRRKQMWIRTLDGRLVNLDQVVMLQAIPYGPPATGAGQIDAYLGEVGNFHNKEHLPVSIYDTKQEAQAALDRIHEWLNEGGYVSEDSMGQVLDLRAKEGDK
jgi:ribosomal protein S16